MKVCPVTLPVPVMVLPTSVSSVWSRKALPPTRRRMCCSPASVRRTTAMCSLFEPIATGARDTTPVIRRCWSDMSPSDVFGDLCHAIVLGMRHQDSGLRQDLALLFCWLGRCRPMLNDEYNFLFDLTCLHLQAVMRAADHVEGVDILPARAKPALAGELANQIVQRSRWPQYSFARKTRAIGRGLAGGYECHASGFAGGGEVNDLRISFRPRADILAGLQ